MAFVTSSARVNGETLGQFEGRPVILVGRIESQIDDNSYSLIATASRSNDGHLVNERNPDAYFDAMLLFMQDKKQVTVSMPPGMSLSVG